MMEDSQLENTSYVLFGDDAIKIYKMSLKLLLSSRHVNYKVGAYQEVKPFMAEAANWDNYIEIPKSDYLKLIQNKVRTEESSTSKRKGLFSFFKCI
ncbi:hypothetical protein MWU59_10975 [Flavobacteriaceae bacterium F08102]|nr:hypothetical protein [Flavobacteriaceae bacterium F08102]